jgi:hypothetical protein
MTHAPNHDDFSYRLTKAEALRTVEQYSYLAGQPYHEYDHLLGTIVCAAVSPHDAINKWLFIHYYADCRDPQKALSFYGVPYFDVILIIETTHARRFTYRNLGAYLAMVGERQKTG